MIKKTIVLTTLLTLLFGLSSCSNDKVSIKDYKNETTYSEFIKLDDQFRRLAKNKDFILTQKTNSTRNYEIIEDEDVIETYDATSNSFIEIKNDFDNKVIQQKSNSNSKSLTKKNIGKEESKSNSEDEKFSQYYNDKYYEFDKDSKETRRLFNYDVYLNSFFQISNIISTIDFDKYYVDGNIYTAIDEEDDTKTTLQFILNDDSFVFTMILDSITEIELNNGKIKKETKCDKNLMEYKFKDVDITPLEDLSDYKFN